MKYVELNLFPEEEEEFPRHSIPNGSKEQAPSANEVQPPFANEAQPPSASRDYDLTDLFARLSKSSFRSRFRLSAKDKEYKSSKGLATIPNDGKQTPMRGHPVFIAQHATGCCCRGCFSKWHHIPAGRQLTIVEQQYAVAVLMAWIERQI